MMEAKIYRTCERGLVKPLDFLFGETGVERLKEAGNQTIGEELQERVFVIYPASASRRQAPIPAKLTRQMQALIAMAWGVPM